MRSSAFSMLLLSACTSIVPMTAMQLSGLSPTTADAADFAVDLTLPAGVDVMPGSARMVFSVRRTDTNESAGRAFVLLRDGTVFRMDPADHDAFRAVQEVAQRWNEEARDDTEGSLSINLAPCRIGVGPAEDATVSVAIQIEQGGGFLPLVRNGPLSAVTSDEQLRDMPDCP